MAVTSKLKSYFAKAFGKTPVLLQARLLPLSIDVEPEKK
jgi:hypothetical protein